LVNLSPKKIPTAAETVERTGDTMIKSKYAREIQEAVGIMADNFHICCMSELHMQELKQKSSFGLYGMLLEKECVREGKDGQEMTISHVMLMAAMCKRLMEEFPDDPVLCMEDYTILDEDPEFAVYCARLLNEYGLIKDCSPEDMYKWFRHAGSAYELEESPKRYWVLKPLDTSEDFRTSRQFCMQLSLIDDGRPVVSTVGAPFMEFDHASRIRESRNGSPLFFAVEGEGAWTQLMHIAREDNGVYSGTCELRGYPLKLNATKKIKRGHDQFYDYLGTNQLHLGIGSRVREDVFKDATRIANLLGSEYPKFEMNSGAIKYLWVARGEVDSAWWLDKGLFDPDKGSDKTADHSAGFLIAKEAGAAITDLSGDDIVWPGPVLMENRGMLVTDPERASIGALLKAVGESTITSTELYERRCEKRQEVSLMLKRVFENMYKFAETDEEKRGALKVMEAGKTMFENTGEMDEITLGVTRRETPILGHAVLEENPFGNNGGM